MTFHKSSAGFVQSKVQFSYHHANEAGNDNLWVDVLACGVKKYIGISGRGVNILSEKY